MEADDSSFPGDGVQERRDVGKANERFGSADQGIEIHSVEQAERAVAAADAPNCIDGRISQRGVQVGQAFVVGTGQIAMASVGMLTQLGLVTQRTAERLRSY
jgi:hypothetical protein